MCGVVKVRKAYAAIKILTITILLCAAAAAPVRAFADEYAEVPRTSARAFSLYCANNGEFIAEQNGTERLPMASTTKIMTALLAIEAYERGECDTIAMSAEMYAEGSSMYLADGEVLKTPDLVGGMLMVSGNDAANAIAMTIGGSAEGFADKMNDKAAKLGLSDTHFVTPSGLDADGHFTTAEDLARLMAYCMENETFAELTGSASVTADFAEPQGKSQTYYNENKLLSSYEYCIGGKTGYTDKAGRTLVSCAERDGVRLICVTLNDGDDWNDHTALYNYGFSRISPEQPEINSGSLTVKVVGGEDDETACVCGQPPMVVAGSTDVTVSYELPPFVYAPVEAGEKLGEAKFYTGGVYAGKTDITAESAVAAANSETTFLENIASWFHGLAKLIRNITDRIK